MTARPSIFVNIASYRDPECQWTLADLFAKARHPERVFVGICWQFVPEQDQHCFLVRPRPEQVRVVEVHADHGRGTCWARAQAYQLWRGEDYVLQIDAHSRFVADWDEVLLATLAECPSPRPILSAFLSGYDPPDSLAEPTINAMVAKEFPPSGILLFEARAVPLRDAPAAPEPTPFVVGHLIFGPSDWIREVPYDPHLYFFGEEISLAVRLWTSGWDIFVPHRHIAWHDYGLRLTRKRHWQDYADGETLNQRAFARVRHLLGMEASDDPQVTAEIERYGLGGRRSLAEYQAFAGIDFRHRLIGGLDPAAKRAAMSPGERAGWCAQVFGDIWRNNRWGNAESRSGDGATLAATEALRAGLPRLFELLRIEVLADAGCGDLTWMSTLAPPLRVYLGYDIVHPLIAELRQRWGGYKNWGFNIMDICSERVVQADAILCRDCLTHLPLAMATDALGRFKASGARLLLATTHATGRNTDITMGEHHPMDLTAPPFSLPPPRLLLPEPAGGGGKALGVWMTTDIL